MKKSVKTILIIAGASVGTGLLLILLSLIIAKGDISTLISVNTDCKAVVATFDEASIVNISDVSNDVKIIKTDSDEIKVTYYVGESFDYLLEKTDDTLSIMYRSRRNLLNYMDLFNFGCSLTVELPDKCLEKLSVSCVSGSITAKEAFADETFLKTVSGEIIAAGSLGKLEAESTSGDIFLDGVKLKDSSKVSSTSGSIKLQGELSEYVKLSAVSGEIAFDCVTANSIEIDTTSGSVRADNSELKDLSVNTMSGDVYLDSVKCSESINFVTVSGEQVLKNADAGDYFLKSTSGDIEAYILSPKLYSTKSTGGSINVPPLYEGSTGYMNLETTSGDINVKILKTESSTALN